MTPRITFTREGGHIRVQLGQPGNGSAVDIRPETMRAWLPRLAEMTNDAASAALARKRAKLEAERARVDFLAEEVARMEAEVFAGELSDVSRILEACLDGTNKPVIVIGDENSDRPAALDALLRRIDEGADFADLLYPTPAVAGAAKRRIEGLGLGIMVGVSATVGAKVSTRSCRFVIFDKAGGHLQGTEEGGTFALAERRTMTHRGGKLIAFFDVADTHIAEAMPQYERARKFRLPIARPGS